MLNSFVFFVLGRQLFHQFKIDYVLLQHGHHSLKGTHFYLLMRHTGKKRRVMHTHLNSLLVLLQHLLDVLEVVGVDARGGVARARHD